MNDNTKAETDRTAKSNAISVIKKLITGTIVILMVGVCAYLCLILLMKFI